MAKHRAPNNPRRLPVGKYTVGQLAAIHGYGPTWPPRTFYARHAALDPADARVFPFAPDAAQSMVTA